MKSPTALLIVGTLCLLLALIVPMACTMIFGNRGYIDIEAQFADLMPGEAKPLNVRCTYFSEFAYLYSGNRPYFFCRIDPSPYCRAGYVMGYEEIIAHLNLSACNQVALGALIKSHGRWGNESHNLKSSYLRWPDLFVIVRETRVDPLSNVQAITWFE